MNTNNIQISILVTLTEPRKTDYRTSESSNMEKSSNTVTGPMVTSPMVTGLKIEIEQHHMNIEPTVSITDNNDGRCDMEIDSQTIYMPPIYPIHPVNMEID